MAFFGLFGKKPDPEPEVREYDKLAVPDPEQPEGKAPYIEAWTGYAPKRLQVPPSEMHTAGREPRQVKGDYPASEMEMVEEAHWKTAPDAIQDVKEFAPDPRWAALKRPALRVQRAPTTYRVTNPFDWQLAHNLNGFHFSMANHIRTYAIGGMEPVLTRRNTFRLMPPPHDVNQTNVGNTAFDVSDMDMQSPISAWRSPTARLGGG
jgi:hypothetical protein